MLEPQRNSSLRYYVYDDVIVRKKKIIRDIDEYQGDFKRSRSTIDQI